VPGAREKRGGRGWGGGGGGGGGRRGASPKSATGGGCPGTSGGRLCSSEQAVVLSSGGFRASTWLGAFGGFIRCWVAGRRRVPCDICLAVVEPCLLGVMVLVPGLLTASAPRVGRHVVAPRLW